MRLHLFCTFVLTLSALSIVGESAMRADEPKAGNTLRMTELRICQIPERLSEADSSRVRRSTVIRSLKGEMCRRSAPGAFTTDAKRPENSLSDSTW